MWKGFPVAAGASLAFINSTTKITLRESLGMSAESRPRQPWCG
ncbi:hypothetical protein BRCON_1005 [Candidatus Sumerlaea chitinivorans]|uniref:Uncharacterized protein n=1 Tax=Sumerlaea chitinivorans TaxID=2250252 RepID=A0A2Z4Y4X4_SUMC1|nr:hypothetical protein BRCON_1005 [Candidatus Sumerlaea chitinivorans]